MIKLSFLIDISTQLYRLITIVLYFVLLCYGTAIHAENSPLLFNLNSVTYQQGNNYKVGDNKKEITTFEHFSAWTWGDVFFFYDHLKEKHTSHSGYYHELSPRISLTSITGRNLGFGPINDLLLAATFERGSDGFNAWLLGAGLDWKAPGFKHLSSNFYYRDTEGVADATWQLTLTWDTPFSLGNYDFIFDGYTDIRGNEGTSKGDLNFNPQLKMDIGKLVGFSNSLYAGIEYSYWNNKFGINGVDERNVSGLLKFQASF